MAKMFFKSDDEFQVQLPGITDISLDSAKPRILSVTSKYILPILSQAQFTDLLNKYDQADYSDIERGLIELIQGAVAHLTMAIGSADFDVKASNGGFKIANGQNSDIASRNRVLAYRDQRVRDGQEALDSIILYLETNADSFISYKNSSERKALFASFVYNSDIIGAYVVPAPGRWVLTKMRGCINRVEQTIIRPMIGNELFEFMINKLKSRDSLGAYEPLLPLIQSAVSHLAFAQAIPELSIEVDSAWGVYIKMQKNANETDQTTNKSGAETFGYIQINEKYGNSALELLKGELLKNLGNYPLYANSSAYTSPKDSSVSGSQNGFVVIQSF